MRTDFNNTVGQATQLISMTDKAATPANQYSMNRSGPVKVHKRGFSGSQDQMMPTQVTRNSSKNAAGSQRTPSDSLHVAEVHDSIGNSNNERPLVINASSIQNQNGKPVTRVKKQLVAMPSANQELHVQNF